MDIKKINFNIVLYNIIMNSTISISQLKKQFKKYKKAIKRSLMHKKKPSKKDMPISINEIEIVIDPEKIIEKE